MKKSTIQIKKVFHNFLEYLKRGGVTYVDVVTVAPDKQLKGKTALITGGSSGIGKAIAEKFLAQGARVIISGRQQSSLDAVKQELSSENLHTVCGDVSDIQSAEKFLRNCLGKTDGYIDILVNNAGVYTDASLAEITESEWDRIMDVNLKGLYFMCQKYIHYVLQQKKPAKIINISSNRSFLGDEGPYGPSKAGVNILTRGLAKMYLPYNIIVNGIAPGSTVSNINKRDFSENLYSNNNAHKRLLLPDEVASLALYLASDISNSIIGQTIVIDGGAILL